MNRSSLFSFVACLLLAVAGVAKAQAPAEPTNLTVKALGTNAFEVKWQDNATNEKGYQIFLAVKGTQPALFKTVAVVNATTDIVVTNALPNLAVTIQVAAYNGDDLKPVRSKLSPPVTVRTPGRIVFGTPAKLRATAVGDGQVSLTFKDQSNSETAFQIEFKLASEKKWIAVLQPPSNNSDRSISGLLPATAYQFRIKAFRQINGLPLKSTRYSNIANVTTKSFLAPSNLVVTAEPDARFSINLKTNSDIANGYEFERKTGTSDFLVFIPNSLVRYDPNTDYQFRVRAFRFVNAVKIYSDYSNVVAIRSTLLLKPTNLAVTASVSTGVTLTWSKPSTRTNTRTEIELHEVGATTNLSPYTGIVGLTYTPTGLQPGKLYEFRIRATLTSGSVTSTSDFTTTVQARVTDGLPVINSPISPVNVAAASSTVVALTTQFSDPDVSQAVRVATSLGTYDIVLFPVATPLTVTNFLSYVSAGNYNDSFFHRAPSNFVVQGGGFNVDSTTGAITKINTLPAVLNEPGISNLRGTVAMAKLGNLPNSATSQFFVSLANNASNLDNQNGGFTVFGRVPTAGMAVLDAINLLPRRTPAYSVPVGGAPTTFDDLPLNGSVPLPSLLDPNQLVKVNTIATTPVLTYTVLSQNAAVATASVVGSNITIQGVATGSTTVLVTATDLDGLTVSQSINVTVP
jgi:cyclophilin family peptidyl-prolyl cis-trans isomerase